MARLAVGGLIAIARFQGEAPAIGEFGLQFSLQTKDDVPLRTPMVCQIAA